jgi:hypothetical protein
LLEQDLGGVQCRRQRILRGQGGLMHCRGHRVIALERRLARRRQGNRARLGFFGGFEQQRFRPLPTALLQRVQSGQQAIARLPPGHASPRLERQP